MADVRPRRPGAGGSDRRERRGGGGDDRGQLLLVTALALGVLLVSLALLLNTAIYTENLATRSADPGSADALGHQRDAVQGVGGAIAYVNAHHAETNETLHANLTASVRAWDDATARHAAVDADAAVASVASTTNGTQAVQNRTRNFTAADGAADWNLTTDVAPDRGLRAFRLSVYPGELASVASPDSPSASALTSTFYVNVTEDDGDWHRIHVYENGSEAQVATYDGATVETSANCSAAPTNDTVAVDLTAGTVGGDECAPLSAFSDADDQFDVAYRNANAVNGTYSVVVNRSTLGADPGAFDTRSSGNVPYSAPAVYAVEVDLAFESQRVTYEATVRIAPGEAGDD